MNIYSESESSDSEGDDTDVSGNSISQDIASGEINFIQSEYWLKQSSNQISYAELVSGFNWSIYTHLAA